MTSQPNALCFGRTFPATGVPCRVIVTSDGLTVSGPAVEHGMVISFSRLRVGAGGFDHDQLVLKWDEQGIPMTLYLKEPEVIHAFRERVPQALSSALQHTADEVRHRRRQRRTVLPIAAAVVSGLLLLLWLGSDRAAEFAVSRIPISWEASLGEAAYNRFIQVQTLLKDGSAVEAVGAISDRLTAALTDSPYRFRVAVMDSEVVNAFALPGGYVMVYTGLLNKAESAEEVAGILAHEVNHVLKRHAMERLVKTVGLTAVVTILTGNHQGLAGIMQELGIELARLKFSREQESEADVEGLRLLHRAKIAPEGMITFFQRLAEQDAHQVEMLSSHPMSEGRAARLKVEQARLPRMTPEPFRLDWAQIHVALSHK